MIEIEGRAYQSITEISRALAVEEGRAPSYVRKWAYGMIDRGLVETVMWNGVHLLDEEGITRLRELRQRIRDGSKVLDDAQPRRVRELGADTMLTLEQARRLTEVDERRITRLVRLGIVRGGEVDGKIGVDPREIDAIKGLPRSRGRTHKQTTGRRVEYGTPKPLTPLEIAVLRLREGDDPPPSYDEILRVLQEANLTKSNSRQNIELAYRKAVAKRETLRAFGLSDDVIMQGSKK